MPGLSRRTRSQSIWPRTWAYRVLNEAKFLTVESPSEGVQTFIRDAVLATTMPEGVHCRVLDWWRGLSITRAHAALHTAKISRLDHLPVHDLNAITPSIVARAVRYLPGHDAEDTIVGRIIAERDLGRKRAELKYCLAMAYDATDAYHIRVRELRNLIWLGALITTAVLGGLVVVGGVWPNFIPLCFPPPAGAPGGEALLICPSGEHALAGSQSSFPKYHPQDAVIVAVMGLLGGSLAAATAVRNLPKITTPFDIPLAVAYLKVPMGGLTAVTGLVLLGGEFVPGFSQLDSQRQILAYAVVLGYAQQIFTRLIDRHAAAILNQAPESGRKNRPRPAVSDETDSTRLGNHSGHISATEPVATNGQRSLATR